MEEPQANFTSVFADVDDALVKLEKTLRAKIQSGSFWEKEKDYIQYLVSVVDPAMNLRTKAISNFAEQYSLYETVKQIEDTENKYNKVKDLLGILETKQKAQQKIGINTNNISSINISGANIQNKSVNWTTKPRRHSFTDRLRGLNPFTKRRTKSFGGKRAKKTRKH